MGDLYLEGIPDAPFRNEPSYSVSGTPSTSSDGYYLEVVTPVIFNLADLNTTQKVFSVNAYLYHDIPVQFYEVSYFYTVAGNETSFIERIAPGPPEEWVRVGRTFDHGYQPHDVSVRIRVYFSDPAPARFLINGFSVGQWSEPHSDESLGVYPIEIPKFEGISAVFNQKVMGVPLREYGPGLDTGYALVANNRLLASNGGIPLVYGSDSVTTLLHHDGMPSIVVPGKGMLNNAGRFNTYTLEAWVRIENESSNSIRIIGPVATDDGIYIKGNTLSISVGGNFASHYIGEWYRPMLLHLTIKSGEASLMLNGERIISLPFDQSKAVLPTNTLYNQDWIGLYTSDEVAVFEVDTVSIFPYVVPSAVAKRRYVWGQGVESPETINSAYLGTTHMVDFAYADYDVNHSYPEKARWDAGEYENLIVTKHGVKAPDYELPEIYAGRRTAKDVLETSKTSWLAHGGAKFITFADAKPISPSYLLFRNSDKIIGDSRAFYGVFSGTEFFSKPLFVFEHKTTGQQLRADVADQVISYSFDNEVFQTELVFDETFVAGLDFTAVPREIADFLSDMTRLELYVAGDKQYTYLGRVYRVGFCSPENFNSMGIAVSDNGTLDPTAELLDHVASYTLTPMYAYGHYYLDIGVAGSWIETFPLGYLASKGRIDLIQYNVGAATHGRTRVETRIFFNEIDDPNTMGVDNVIAPDYTGVVDLTKGIRRLTALATDGTVLVMPDGDLSDFNMTVRLDVKIEGIRTDAFFLKDMSLATHTSDKDRFSEIGTTQGTSLAPFSRVGYYYTPEIGRAWSVYKRSTPYLHLTGDSGIRPLSTIKETTESGLWVTMNKERERDFKVSSMQIWAKLSDHIGEEPVELFSVKSDRVWIKFMGVDDGTHRRVKVYSVDGYTGADYTGVRFFQDGKQTILPFMEHGTWTALGINFEPLLDLTNDIGSICLISGCVYNNIVFYKTSSLQEQYVHSYRTWADVKSDGKTWQFWKSEFNGVGATWDEVSKAATISRGIRIDQIYRAYVGTNRTVVGDDSQLLFDGGTSTIISNRTKTESDQYTTNIVVTNAPEWQSITKKPV